MPPAYWNPYRVTGSASDIIHQLTRTEKVVAPFIPCNHPQWAPTDEFLVPVHHTAPAPANHAAPPTPFDDAGANSPRVQVSHRARPRCNESADELAWVSSGATRASSGKIEYVETIQQQRKRELTTQPSCVESGQADDNDEQPIVGKGKNQANSPRVRKPTKIGNGK